MPSWLTDWLTSAVLKSWQTTLAGALIGAWIGIKPAFDAGRWPTKSEWLMFVGAVITGMVTKQHNVTSATNATNVPSNFKFPSHTGDN